MIVGVTVDASFADAVHAAAAGSRADLVEWLCSDKPLRSGERQLLAALINGDMKRRKGRLRPKVEYAKMRDVAVEYLDRTDAGEKGEHVTTDICARLGISRSKFHASLEQVRASIERLDARGLDGRAAMSPK